MRKKKIRKDLRQCKKELPFFIMMLAPVVYFLLFNYWPMFGISIAFQNYKLGSPFISGNTKWVGLKWFKTFMENPYFGRYIKNTLAISLLDLFVSFPISIAFALILNEIRKKGFRKFASNISLLPHFISVVVVVGLVVNAFSLEDGVVNKIIAALGGTKVNFLGSPEWFRPLYIGSGIWQNTGFNAIVFTAAIAGIDPTLYEAAAIDGSDRFKNMLYITLPCIVPTIIIMFLLKVGGLMSIGYEKIILMQTPVTYETSDILTTYSYRVGFTSSQYSLSAAITFMNSLCNVILVCIANTISKKFTETSLW